MNTAERDKCVGLCGCRMALCSAQHTDTHEQHTTHMLDTRSTRNTDSAIYRVVVCACEHLMHLVELVPSSEMAPFLNASDPA